MNHAHVKVRDKNMTGIYHGEASLKENMLDKDGNVLIEKDVPGVITAYLPDMDKFAIFFGEGKWITFNDTEEDFKKRVNILSLDV